MAHEPYAGMVVDYIAHQCRTAKDAAEHRLAVALAELRASDVSDDEIFDIERRVRESLIDCPHVAQFALVSPSA